LPLAVVNHGWMRSPGSLISHVSPNGPIAPAASKSQRAGSARSPSSVIEADIFAAYHGQTLFPIGYMFPAVFPALMKCHAAFVCRVSPFGKIGKG